MKSKRSDFIIWFVLVIACCFPFVLNAADASATPPADTLLEAGDLIWPKKPGTFIPYYSRLGVAEKSDAARWRKERDAYLARIQQNPKPSAEESKRYKALQKMTYEDFVGYYLSDNPPGKAVTYGLGGIDVGHVGIIEIRNGRPFVVEAMWGPGVQRISYAEWANERPGQLFWIARLKNLPREKRAAVAEQAAEQIGKLYNFWDFDLEDASGFYCSKLAWLSILRGWICARRQ